MMFRRMSSRRLAPRGMRTRLILLTLLAMTPLVVLLAIQADVSRRLVITEAQHHAAALAKVGAAQENDVIQEVQDIFRVLGRVPEITAPPDAARCGAVLAAVVRDHRQVLFLATTNPAGTIVCASDPAAIGASLAQWQDFAEVGPGGHQPFLLSRTPAIPGLPLSASITAMAPAISVNDKPVGVFVAALDLHWFTRLTAQIANDPNNRAEILNTADGTLLAASPSVPAAAGTRDPEHPALLAFGKHPEGGVVEGRDTDQKACIYGYAPVETSIAGHVGSGTILAVGISRQSVMEHAKRRFIAGLCLALLAIAAAVGGVIWLAETSFIRPVGLLAATARRLSRGDLGARVTIDKLRVAELRMLGDTLNGMATSLERLALTDPLTGLANRRRLDAALAEEVARAARHGRPLALLMIDADNFKKFNDRYGHAAGDECLRQVAKALQSVVRRPGDLAARYGGEEFVMLLPETDAESARQLAERLLVTVRDLGIPHAESPHGRVTISVGLAVQGPADAADGAALQHRADLALYEAKRDGRDRVVLAG